MKTSNLERNSSETLGTLSERLEDACWPTRVQISAKKAYCMMRMCISELRVSAGMGGVSGGSSTKSVNSSFDSSYKFSAFCSIE